MDLPEGRSVPVRNLFGTPCREVSVPDQLSPELRPSWMTCLSWAREGGATSPRVGASSLEFARRAFSCGPRRRTSILLACSAGPGVGAPLEVCQLDGPLRRGVLPHADWPVESGKRTSSVSVRPPVYPRVRLGVPSRGHCGGRSTRRE